MSRGIRPRIILVTDPTFGDDFIVRQIVLAGKALPAGWLCVQLRDKRRGRLSLRLFASRLRLVTRAVGATLVINGDATIARDVGADGIHLGRDAGVGAARRIFGEDAWISVAAHSDDAVRIAVDSGADAVLVCPVFSTRPPLHAEPEKIGRGTGALRSARAIVGSCEAAASVQKRRVSVYALGGVTGENAVACVGAGADGVAVMRAVLASAEPARMMRSIHDAIARRC
jgi:thiamine-phosphate pyrophosphorylase